MCEQDCNNDIATCKTKHNEQIGILDTSRQRINPMTLPTGLSYSLSHDFLLRRLTTIMVQKHFMPVIKPGIIHHLHSAEITTLTT